MVDQQLALSVYLRAKPAAHTKVIQCFMETGQFDKIMVYCQKVSYTADWGFLLANIVRVNPAGALEFAQKLPMPLETRDGFERQIGVPRSRAGCSSRAPPPTRPPPAAEATPRHG